MKNKATEILSLDRMLLQIVRRQLLLPLLVIWIATICGTGYFFMQMIVHHQQQVVNSMTRMAENNLDNGVQILEAAARAADNSAPNDTAVFMQSTWEAYKYFDTIYCLDSNSKVVLMAPHNAMYAGLDMSNMPDFKNSAEQNGVHISRPFISLRTGCPTVYLVRRLSRGGCVVGELNLSFFQLSVTGNSSVFEENSVFILDQSGTLIAHSQLDLVRQQINMSQLEIFRKGLKGDAADIYECMGTMYLGNAAKISQVGWVIVDQAPVLVLIRPYIITFTIIVFSIFLIWLALVWSFRKELQQNVALPLVQLSHSTNALAAGNYNKVSKLVSAPNTFAELNKVTEDFLSMSNTLEMRQAALLEAQEELETRVDQRTADLSKANLSLSLEITERKNIEEQLKLKNQELIKAYAELENAQAQVIYQEKMASIGQIAAAVAHEIRNPLTTVRGYLQLMGRKKQYQGYQEQLSIMIEEIDRANAIIREYLFLSREKVANLRGQSLNAIIECLLPLIQAAANEAKVLIKLELGEMKDLLLDENEIRQLLLNLVRNSIDAMPLGGEVIIRTVQKENYGVLSVSDQGSGIPPHVLNKLGTPFITTKDTGTGLGLPMCYQIVDRHKAKIEIETSTEGTTFMISFPYLP
jgi:signal transduction histidine kinase